MRSICYNISIRCACGIWYVYIINSGPDKIYTVRQSVASSNRVVHTMRCGIVIKCSSNSSGPQNWLRYICVRPDSDCPSPCSSVCLPDRSTVLALWFAILRHYSRSLVAVWHKFICSRRCRCFCRRKLPFYYCRRSWPSHHSRSRRLHHLLHHLLLRLHLCLDLRHDLRFHLDLSLSHSHSIDSHHGDLIEFTLKLVMDICSSTNYSHPHTHTLTHKTTTDTAALGI